MRLKYKRIACDYDGTIAFDSYPEVGAVKEYASVVLRRVKEAGGQIIIWTCRTGKDAEEVKKKLADAGIEYDAFNDNLPETQLMFPDNSRKVFADVYIDDKANFCEEIDWFWIESKLFEREE
jgi:ribonucleotide monophosphatase NagD (HAD superfamily)